MALSFFDDNLTNHLLFGFYVGQTINKLVEPLYIAIIIFGPGIEGAIDAITSLIILHLHNFGPNQGFDISKIINGKYLTLLNIPNGKDGKSIPQMNIGAITITIQRKIKSIPPQSISNRIIQLLQKLQISLHEKR